MSKCSKSNRVLKYYKTAREQSMPLMLSMTMPTLTTVVTAWAVTMTAISGWQLFTRESRRKLVEEAHKWETAAHAFEATATAYQNELVVVRESRDRLGTENEVKAKRIGVLEAKTDLDGVRQQLADAQADIAKHVAEGNLAIIGAIQTISKDIMQGFARHAQDDANTMQRIVRVMDDMEKRMNAGFEDISRTMVSVGSSGDLSQRG